MASGKGGALSLLHKGGLETCRERRVERQRIGPGSFRVRPLIGSKQAEQRRPTGCVIIVGGQRGPYRSISQRHSADNGSENKEKCTEASEPGGRRQGRNGKI